MATNTLNTRIVICSKTTAQWANITTVPMKGEVCLEWTNASDLTIPPKVKVGNGTDTFANLPYVFLSESEIKALLEPATASKLGGVKIGSNISVAADGTISVPTASATSASAGTAGVMSVADKNKLNNIQSGAEVNQNAFSNVKVGSTTIAADAKTDTLELVAGTNITLTPDETNDKVTIASTASSKVDGVSGSTVNRYGVCTTENNVAAKTVTIKNGTFTLEEGARVSVLFKFSNNAINPTLNVNNTGAKSIIDTKGSLLTTEGANVLDGLVDFIYIIPPDESSAGYWRILNSYPFLLWDKDNSGGYINGDLIKINNATISTSVDSYTQKQYEITIDNATSTTAGLMSAEDKTIVNSLATGAVTGVKGNAETTYRTGQVNITAANIGVSEGADVTSIGVTDKTAGQQNSNEYWLTTGKGIKIDNSTVTLNQTGTWAEFTIDNATTSQKGIVQLSSATNSTSTTTAATPSAVKSAYDLANAAMPKSGGTFTGAVTLNADPTADLGAATKQYVDSQITSKIAASDAMVFKGTLGTGGTVTAVPTSNVTKGDTYKIITAGTWAGYSGCKIGDLLIAMTTGASVTATTTNWAYVPSGDESTTSIKYSTTTQNLTTSAQTGAITVGEAATKQVDTSISAASTSTKLPTSQAVATFVEGKGYITSSGTANKANTLTTPRTIAVGGSATSTATSFDGSQNITIPLTGVDTNILYQTAGNTLIIDGNFT